MLTENPRAELSHRNRLQTPFASFVAKTKEGAAGNTKHFVPGNAYLNDSKEQGKQSCYVGLSKGQPHQSSQYRCSARKPVYVIPVLVFASSRRGSSCWHRFCPGNFAGAKTKQKRPGDECRDLWTRNGKLVPQTSHFGHRHPL